MGVEGYGLGFREIDLEEVANRDAGRAHILQDAPSHVPHLLDSASKESDFELFLVREDVPPQG